MRSKPMLDRYRGAKSRCVLITISSLSNMDTRGAQEERLPRLAGPSGPPAELILVRKYPFQGRNPKIVTNFVSYGSGLHEYPPSQPAGGGAAIHVIAVLVREGRRRQYAVPGLSAGLKCMKGSHQGSQFSFPGPKHPQWFSFVHLRVSLSCDFRVNQVDPALGLGQRPGIASSAFFCLLRFALQQLKLGLPIWQGRARQPRRNQAIPITTHAASPRQARGLLGPLGHDPSAYW